MSVLQVTTSYIVFREGKPKLVTTDQSGSPAPPGRYNGNGNGNGNGPTTYTLLSPPKY